jgi:hypothetical protein
MGSGRPLDNGRRDRVGADLPMRCERVGRFLSCCRAKGDRRIVRDVRIVVSRIAPLVRATCRVACPRP